jgi:hypothetical protein
MTESISIREFARREKVSHTLIVQALKAGKLSKLADGGMDAALVGSGWRRPARGPEPDGKAAFQAESMPGAGAVKGVAYGEALRLKENWLALLRRLEYEHKSGSLVDLTVAQNIMFELTRLQRDAWLAWPSKVAPFIALEMGITDLERLTATLETYVYDQLADLGEPEAGFQADAA